MKDPKQVLDMFRTDVHSRSVQSSLLRQFDLEYPNSKKNRRKRQYFKSNNSQTATILSLCLLTGFSVGIGSAFADNEVIPDLRPLDQAPVKAKLEIKESPSVGKNTEPIRDIPPQEPNLKAQDKPSASEVKTDVRYEKKDVAPETNMPKEDRIFKQPAASNHHTNIQDSPNVIKPSTQKETPQTASSQEPIPKERVQAVDLAGPPASNSFAANSLNTKSQSESDSLKTTSDSHASTTETPKTVDGGELPQTAGNDLNGVVMGSSLALLGSIYAWRRKKADETPNEI